MIVHAGSDVSDQSGRMPRLIGVVVGRTCHFAGFCHTPSHRLDPVLKTIFHQCVISYTCSQSNSDGSVLKQSDGSVLKQSHQN